MKYISIISLIVILASCGSENNGSSATDSTGTRSDSTGIGTSGTVGTAEVHPKNNPGKSGPGTSDKQNPGNGNNQSTTGNDVSGAGVTSGNPGSAQNLDNSGAKQVLYVPVFAKWKTDEDFIDGSYDSVQEIFYVCGSNNYEHAPRNQVIYQKYASCDSLPENIIRALKVKLDGTIIPIDSRVKMMGNKGIIKDGNNIRMIQIDPNTIRRINEQKIYRSSGALRMNSPSGNINDNIIIGNEKAKQVGKNVINAAEVEKAITPKPNAEVQMQAPALIEPQKTENKIMNTQSQQLRQPANDVKIIADTAKQLKVKTMHRFNGQ